MTSETARLDRRSSIVVALRSAIHGLAAASAMVGIAVILAFLAARSEGATVAASAPLPPVEAKMASAAVATPRLPAPIDLGDVGPAPVAVAALPDAIQAPPRAVAQSTPPTASRTNARPLVTRAEALVVEADRAYRGGHLTQAAKLYEQALVLSPSFVPARLGAAAAAWDSGRREEARAKYRAVVSDAPHLVPDVARERAR